MRDRDAPFFACQTLKYLYLLFSDDDVLPLDRRAAIILHSYPHNAHLFVSAAAADSAPVCDACF